MVLAMNLKGQMKFMKSPERLPIGEIDLRRKRIARDRAAWKRLSDRLIPGLPIDADVLETRVNTSQVGQLLPNLVAKLTEVHEPFFDTVCDNWEKIVPEKFTAKPGRYCDGHLYFYVHNSGMVFSLRSKLPKVKKLLMTLPGAPKKISLHLEVH